MKMIYVYQLIVHIGHLILVPLIIQWQEKSASPIMVSVKPMNARIGSLKMNVNIFVITRLR